MSMIIAIIVSLIKAFLTLFVLSIVFGAFFGFIEQRIVFWQLENNTENERVSKELLKITKPKLSGLLFQCLLLAISGYILYRFYPRGILFEISLIAIVIYVLVTKFFLQADKNTEVFLFVIASLLSIAFYQQ